ncbi:MAG TPA: T9SS type A sorting domain-containing protein [Bacteroidota bacterium]|nr:T9SS type A sorting domain-containing protein [Bacteroidota bacterium]
MKSIWIFLLLSLCVWTASAQHVYLLQTNAASAGGERSSSPNYRMTNSVGSSAIGSSSSPAYTAGNGFIGEVNKLAGFFGSTVAVEDGWNLLSVSKKTGDYRKSVLFPSSSSNAFVFKGTYVERETLKNGEGYWLKFSGNQLITLPGVQITVDTIPVVPGWNLIGSISSTIGTGSITQIPPGIVTSNYFGYNGGYYTAGSIEPGKGIWVKVNNNGQLVLNSLVLLPSTEAASSDHELAEGLNILSVETVDGTKKPYRQELLFGAAAARGGASKTFELPPRAPASKLDVRFPSNRYVAHFAETTIELPVSIQSTAAALRVTLTMNETNGRRYSLVERTDGKVTAEHHLGEGSSVTIVPSEGKTFAIRVEQLPVSYALEQNYPNPFNPTTTIRYSLPVAGHVTLKIYDLLGQEVVTLIDGEQEAGYQSVVWDASNAASDVYFYRVTATKRGTATTFSDMRKMTLVK